MLPKNTYLLKRNVVKTIPFISLTFFFSTHRVIFKRNYNMQVHISDYIQLILL